MDTLYGPVYESTRLKNNLQFLSNNYTLRYDAIDQLCDRNSLWADVSERCLNFAKQFQWETVTGKRLDFYNQCI